VASLLKHDITLQDVIMALPDHRIEGAHLSRDSWRHWLYAGIAASLFFGLLTLAFPASRASPQQVLRIGVFTGTIGILLLICFQVAAAATEGVWLRGFSIVTVLFYIVKFIGYSYAAALDPKSGFLLSCIGFTFGVGFCEEVCKMLPLIKHFRYRATLDWRGACVWGLASGVGFGVSEGISYASRYYNGVQSADIYAVRFISCVALHAVWSCAAAVTLFERQDWLQTHCSGVEFLWRLAQIVAVPMILHGLYDTLLKKDMRAGAFLAAVVSFGWMVYQLERYHRKESPIGTDPVAVASGL
jgi:RsiW-degrading membrane proteinase PrsW (M82 family)